MNHGGLAVSFSVIALAAACSSTSDTSSSPYKVVEATCNACRGESYTPAECADWGEAGGCQTSGFVATVSGCANECKFTNCTGFPTCGAKDAGTDAGRDPACAVADNDSVGKGLFPSDAPCANPQKSTINGSVRYACPCGTCPCGYQCGSIALAVGGSLGSVCAPP